MVHLRLLAGRVQDRERDDHRRARDALPWLQWVQSHALPSGVLAEQINPYTHEPLSVSPLTWSHAEYAGAIRWYIGRYQHLTHLAAQAGAQPTAE